MKTLKKILIIIVILGLGIMAFLYFGIYSEGTRAGIIMKVSSKGALIKTWEGQMNLETFGAMKSTNMVSETFSFSIEDGNPELIEELNAAALSGERVNLRYIERYISVFWRGETKYFAIGVETSSNKTGEKEKDARFPRH